MTATQERRRHRRYRLRSSVMLRRAGAEVAAELFNASLGGCLLVTQVRLTAGERLEVTLPALGGEPRFLHVVRTRSVDHWYVAAASFEPALSSEELLARLSSEEPGVDEEPDSLL
jgi:hypothetical protein